MMIINVKSKEENALGVGYSFKINEPETPQTDLVYLNENKVKQFILKERTLTEEQKANHFSIGLLGTTLPIMANAISSNLNQTLTVSANTSVATIKHINLMQQLLPIVHLIQDLALPVAIVIGCWACIEWIVGSPAWKHKLKGSIIGLVGIYLIPFLYQAIGSALGTL